MLCGFCCITPISAFILTRPSPCVLVCVQMSPLYKDHHHIGLGVCSTTMWLHLSLTNYICNDPISKHGHLLRCWGLGLQHMNCGRETIQLIILHKAQGPANHLAKPSIQGGRGGRADLGDRSHRSHWLYQPCRESAHCEGKHSAKGSPCLPQLGNVITHS